MRFKIGIDVGGTFTDLVVLSSSSARIETFKALSTPDDPSRGVLDGLALIAKANGRSLAELASAIDLIVHGTTVTTNATLTRRGAKTALLTTRGVRDALEMRRGIREAQYDNRFTNVPPLVERWLRRPVTERIDARGAELTPLELADVREATDLFRGEGIEAVAICFMNSFANPTHEENAAALVREAMPNAYVSVSSELLPTVRFYNRISTTTLNAYVGPILARYLDGLTKKLDTAGFGGVLLIMQSSGGVASPEVTSTRAANTLLSGPAGGPRAASAYTRVHGGHDAILVDMGGTSFDASLIRNGEAEMIHEGEIDRLRTALPMLAISTIGAGGGSVGWIDAGGLLRMGPQSAGAAPGPACYRRGGTLPTCTDANVVLGYLDPAYFAGGTLELDARRAHDAIEEHIAKPLAMSVEEAASGMYRVINTNMAHGVRAITVERGLDPRDFTLVVAGGAGALHGVMIARELEMQAVLVPNTASVFCATGMLMSDLEHDFVRSHVARFVDLDRARVRTLVEEMIAEGDRQLDLEQVPSTRRAHRVALDLRYVKQYHEVSVDIPIDDVLACDLGSAAKRFHGEHDRLYGYNLEREGTDLELINVRVKSVGKTEKPELPTFAHVGPNPDAAKKGIRRAFVPETNEFAPIPVYDGHRLATGNIVRGPALIERTDTTIFVSASFVATIDSLGSARIERRT